MVSISIITLGSCAYVWVKSTESRPVVAGGPVEGRKEEEEFLMESTDKGTDKGVDQD
jgi:hypothetical protein